jgi:hypothetical protein
LTFAYLSEDFLNVFSFKRLTQANELVNKTSKGPYVRFAIVTLAFPNFRAGVGEGTGSGVEESIVNLADVEVSDLDYSSGVEQYIAGLNGEVSTLMSLWITL